MRSRLAAVLAAALTLAACADEPAEDPVQTAVVPEADVERFRAEAFLATLDLDADLARFEADVAATDSAARLGYGPVLDRLRSERQRLQVRIDSLRPLPRARFDSTSAALLGQVQGLRRSVQRGRLEGAPSFPALLTVAERDLANLDARLVRIAAVAERDTTGALRRGVDSLAADRARVAARIGAYPDTSQAQFPPFRTAVTDALLQLDRRADALAADTVRSAAGDAARGNGARGAAAQGAAPAATPRRPPSPR